MKHHKIAIAFHVVLIHVAVLWALQSGLLRQTMEIIVPAEIISEFVSPPVPQPEPPLPPQPVVRQLRQPPAPVAPQPVVQAAPVPPPLTALAPATTPAPAAPAAPAAPVAAAPVAKATLATAAPVAPPTPAKLELPSSDAAYLNNPKPSYPALSKRLGEQGKVVLRVLIGVDGTAQQAEIRTSSGYERLDQTALATVLKWRYVPGKRSGVPEAMWFNVPINFVLE